MKRGTPDSEWGCLYSKEDGSGLDKHESAKSPGDAARNATQGSCTFVPRWEDLAPEGARAELQVFELRRAMQDDELAASLAQKVRAKSLHVNLVERARVYLVISDPALQRTQCRTNSWWSPYTERSAELLGRSSADAGTTKAHRASAYLWSKLW